MPWGTDAYLISLTGVILAYKYEHDICASLLDTRTAQALAATDHLLSIA